MGGSVFAREPQLERDHRPLPGRHIRGNELEPQRDERHPRRTNDDPLFLLARVSALAFVQAFWRFPERVRGFERASLQQSCRALEHAIRGDENPMTQDPATTTSAPRTGAPGWICPRCGGGNAIWSPRCPCVPIPSPPVTCDTSTQPATPPRSSRCPICRQRTLLSAAFHACGGHASWPDVDTLTLTPSADSF